MKRFEVTYTDTVWADSEVEAVKIAADALGEDAFMFTKYAVPTECEEESNDGE